MRKALITAILVAAVLLCGLLIYAFCPGTILETEQQFVWKDTVEHWAFREVLRRIYTDRRWPALEKRDKIDVSEYGMEAERFAVTDVDGDGQEELIISVVNTSLGDMCEVIYGCAPKSGFVRAEAQVFPSVIHYRGLLKVNASHSHGLAGDVLWPYDIWTYHAETDAYKPLFSVDAWDKAISDHRQDMPFPEDIDTDGKGYVYLVTQDEITQYLSEADYLAWEAALLSEREPIVIPWQYLTSENIRMH